MATSRTPPLLMLLGAIFFFASNVFAVNAVLGVDLGTEYIKASLVKPGIPLDIVLTKDSRRKETSAVVFKPTKAALKDGEFPERAYGADAMALAARFPGDVYPNLKTILGLNFEDAVVKEYIARHPALRPELCPVRGTTSFKSGAFGADEDAWSVEELLAMEFQSVQANAEAAAGGGSSIRSTVITVPAFFTADEKRAVQTAAELAGLKVLSLISDGLAVGLNYATTRKFPHINDGEKPEYHMVFDMGAGSTKATIMKFQSRTFKEGRFNKTVQEVQVVGSGWDRVLGGDALNSLIVDDMVAKFIESKGAQKISATAEDVKAHGRAIAKLSGQAEKVRHVLSANQNNGATFEGLYEDVDFKYKITRAEFEEMAEAHAAKMDVVFNDALKMAGLESIDIASIILHGGATRTPFVQKALEKLAGGDKVRTNVNSDEAAVFGAGFRAAELSPSFRVREIRITDIATYNTGFVWTDATGEAQRQRPWSPVSAVGAPKELTFTHLEDFTAAFWQQVGSEEKAIASLTTKNLTKTVAALKEKYTSCAESEVLFKLSLKLSGATGEVEVAKAAVQCEAEVVEGFVDGVKNLFGFGKKDQKPLKGEKAEEAKAEEGSEEVLKEKASSEESSASSETESSTSSSADAAATPAAEEVKAETKKYETVSIPVEVAVEKTGMPDFTKQQSKKAKDRLKAFAASDKARQQREEALNQLEAFTYKVRDNLEDESFILHSTEDVREKLAELSSTTSDWLYDEGPDATKEVLKAKLKALQDIVKPIQKRVEEAALRPELIAELKTVADQAKDFVEKTLKHIEEYNDWHASASASSETPSATPSGDFDGLEDEDAKATGDRKMEDVLKEKGPVPPVYEKEEIERLSKLHKLVVDWLEEMEPKQAALQPHEEPVMAIRDIKLRGEMLTKAGMELAVKGQKLKKKSGKAGKDTGPIDIEWKGAEGGVPTEEEIQKLLKNINLEDLKNANQDKIKKGAEEAVKKAKEAAKAKEAKKDVPHDEL